MDQSRFQILRFNESEHGILLEPLTQLLHDAYQPLTDRGLRYSATHQAPETTLKRLRYGEGYLAFWEGRLAGTISLMPSKPDSPCEYYRREGGFHFGQFGVKPDLKGRGFGNRLLAFVEERAKTLGGTEMALDTAEPAIDLIKWYERHGYRRVSRTKWASTNYESVIMAKKI